MEKKPVDLVQLFARKTVLEEQIHARNLYARAALKGYSFASRPDPEYLELMSEPSRQMDEVLLEILNEQDRIRKPGPEKFRREDVFVWGGPTQLWGGCMEPDTAVCGNAVVKAAATFRNGEQSNIWHLRIVKAGKLENLDGKVIQDRGFYRPVVVPRETAALEFYLGKGDYIEDITVWFVPR